VRHGGDGLHAAQRHDHVGAGDVHRVEHLGVDAVVAAVARYGVEHAITVGTPAALAVAMLMYADAMCAYRPVGT
jgi:hypothetical protein